MENFPTHAPECVRLTEVTDEYEPPYNYAVKFCKPVPEKFRQGVTTVHSRHGSRKARVPEVIQSFPFAEMGARL